MHAELDQVNVGEFLCDIKIESFQLQGQMVAHSEKRWGRDPLEQTRLDVYVELKNVLKLNSQLNVNAHEISTKL